MSKFVEREFTVREAILVDKAGKGDFESGVLLVESRLVEPIPNLRELPVSDFMQLIEEMGETLQTASRISTALNSISKSTPR